ncbi:hypothetical protein N9448_03180 [Litorivicinus sp.]|jgi:hypothetical protein|nr:hypothetical protein [Litorivicinus sp.]
MHVRKPLEYALVIGVWTTFVFVIVSPFVSEHYTSITIFALFVPLVIYWVLRERLLIWDHDDTDNH